ncbi:unnamed protein product [Peronospora belbahrii]|uniref:FYVE-type domain-containing protein n=1 Tax=Peronospora belbahrii TaxID=622444 RepID=A0AAU9KHA3_9STRA|nr:unnamed protein product [Peronospora belbahrii]
MSSEVTHLPSTNPRGSLETSSEYIARAQEFADARVHKTLQKYHSNRAAASYTSGDSTGVDCSQWKLVKGGGRHHAISCYKKVSPRGQFGGLRRPHRKKQQAIRMTMSRKEMSSVSVSDQAELLAIGQVPGTLEDMLHGTVNLTPEAMQIESAHALCDLLDSRVLTALVVPSINAPFRSLTLKWALRHHEVLSRHRDYVYMEATGVLRDPQDNGARVGYHLVHSVTLSSAPELAPEMQIVRGHLSYCYLYRQHSETQVELFFLGGMAPRGGAKDRLAFALMTEAVLASPSTIECAMMKKLAFSLRTKHLTIPRPHSLPLNHREDNLGPTYGRKSTFGSSIFHSSPVTLNSNHSSMVFDGGLGGSPCRVCHRPVRAFFGGKVTCCEMCEEPVCNRCKVTKKVFVFESGVLHPQKMDFCSECVATTSLLNAGWVASQELTRAANVVHLSAKSSSPLEDHSSKPYVSLGSSSWNGDMSRINEIRATMSLDAAMGHSAPQFVVWLPTDHMHPRLSSIAPMDVEIEGSQPSDDGPENKGYNWCEEDTFFDRDAFVTLDDDDAIPMIDIPSEGEEDDYESD